MFDALKKLYPDNRKIKAFERKGVLRNAVYYDYLVGYKGTDTTSRKTGRREWFECSREKLALAELIFLDPDNGLLVNSKGRNREKYVFPEEVEQLYEYHDVVYYCHKGRRTTAAWEKYKAEMLMRLPSAQPIVLTFHRGTQRSYVFLIHPKRIERYREILRPFMETWKDHFEEESVRVQNRDEIYHFATKWLKRIKNEKNLYRIFDEMDFANDARKVGFVMDAGRSFAEAVSEKSALGDLEAMRRIAGGKEIVHPQLLGAIIHSEWRYVNHWSMAPPSEEDREWFVFMLDWLAKITKHINTEKSRFFKWRNTAITDSDVFGALSEDIMGDLSELYGKGVKQAAADDGFRFFFIHTGRKEITPMRKLSLAFSGQYNDNPPYGDELDSFLFVPSEYKLVAEDTASY